MIEAEKEALPTTAVIQFS